MAKSTRLRTAYMASTAAVALVLASSAFAAPSEHVYQLDIHGESLSQALTDFSLETSQQIIFSEDLVRDQQAPPLRGRYTSHEALSALLDKTDLMASPEKSGVLMIQKKTDEIGSAEPAEILAQNTQPPAQPGQTAQTASTETVIVSASRISIAGYTAPTPVTTLGNDQLLQAANADIGQTLRQLPMMGNSQSPESATMGNAGNAGATAISSVNLRNLGVTRTLVLIDGERQVWAGVQYGVDLNTIPHSLIQRVDIVTGGASAAWGSDAVAGVVNLIINKNFTGLKGSIDLQDTGQDFRRQYGFTLTNGFDLLGGRAHVEWAVTYAHAPNTAYQGQLHWFNSPAQVANPAYNAVTNPNVPRNIIVYNTGETSTPGGIISGAQLTAGGSTTALNGIQFGPGGAISPWIPPNCKYYRTTNLPPYISSSTGTSYSSCYGGSTSAALSANQIGLIAYPMVTNTGFFYGDYKVTPDIQASLMLQYSHVGAIGSSLTFQGHATIQQDNAFLAPSLLARMQALGVQSISVTSIGTASSKGGFIQATPGVGVEQFLTAPGTPEEETSRQFYRAIFTLNGAFGDNWMWNTSYQHSETHLHEHYNSVQIVQNYKNATDAVFVTPANVGTSGLTIGSITCRSTLTDPTNGCVPLNPMGLNVVTQDAINYVEDHNDYYYLTMEQDTAGANMQGVLPWDPFGAGAPSTAFGVEYRKETMVSRADPHGARGELGGGNFVPVRGEYNIVEGFGELDIPILKDNIVDSLNGNMAGRITSYSTSGQVETWKLGLTSQVNEDFRLRGTWSFDIRAPDLAELFNVIPASGGQVDYKTGVNISTALHESAGNPDLKPEKAITWSAGVVLTPHWVPGLSVSLDWYSINVKDIVVSTSTSFERAACLAGTPTPTGVASDPTLGTGYCSYWVYNPTLVTNSNPNGLQFVYSYPFNNGYLKTSGLDFNADYAMDLFDGNLVWHLSGNYTDEETQTEFGVIDPATGKQATYDFAGSVSNRSLFPGVPKFHFVLSATYTQGPWSGTVQTRYIGPAKVVNGWTSGVQVDDNSVSQVAYLDLRGTYRWNENLQVYVSVDNALDIPPPQAVGYSPSTNPFATTNATIYDVLGRMYHAGIRFNY